MELSQFFIRELLLAMTLISVGMGWALWGLPPAIRHSKLIWSTLIGICLGYCFAYLSTSGIQGQHGPDPWPAARSWYSMVGCAIGLLIGFFLDFAIEKKHSIQSYKNSDRFGLLLLGAIIGIVITCFVVID